MILRKWFDAIYHSIKGRLIANVILIHAVLMGFIVYDLVERQQEFMEQQLSAKGYELASILASNASHALLNNDLVALDELLFQMSDIKDSYMIFLLDHTGRVRASTEKSYFNQTLTDSLSRSLIQKAARSEANAHQQIHHYLVDTVHAVRVKNHTIGYARIILDERNLSRQLEIVTNEGVFYTIIAIIIGALFAWLAIRRVTANLNRITDAATRLGNKEFNVVLPDIKGKDEVAKVANAFNVMSSSINKHITEQNRIKDKLSHAHDELELIVEERTKELVEANEKLKSLDRLKSMFIASMSHELRTPLNSIIGFTSVMLTGALGALSEKQKDYLNRVKHSGDHLLDLISDIIDISKIEAGRIEAAPSSFRLVELTEALVKETKILANTKPIRFSVDVDSSIELHTDEMRLKQSLLNFLSNAVKFTEEGTIRITAETVGDDVKISIIDSGIGIHSDDLPKLFEAFERLESHLQVKAGGTGLGLYLTKKLVENVLKGSVGAESEPAKGSCFWLQIPRRIEGPANEPDAG
ncbi:MAG: ATP-binding protein [Sulfurimonadaceae bacterium]|nr:ATP-binding protein [Sulfurimonadaceae bacterium]